jgi:YbbR domain-containing protein
MKVETNRWLKLNRRFYIVLICFSIASVFWLLLALSHEYPASIYFPVSYTNPPGNKIVTNELPREITVHVKTSGFKIISYYFQRDKDSVQVDITASFGSSQVLPELFSISTTSFQSDFSKELGKEVSISGFSPDSIIFNFSDVVTRKVPVVLSLTADFEKQYDTTGKPVLTPSEVEVTGPFNVVDTLKEVRTEQIVLSNLKETVTMKTQLVSGRFLSYSTNEIKVSLPVEKFTEGTVEVEIKAMNAGPGLSLKTFPDKVLIRYQVALSQYNNVEQSMFVAVADAAKIKEKELSKLEVELIEKPGFVRNIILEPSKVDYIIRKQ